MTNRRLAPLSPARPVALLALSIAALAHAQTGAPSPERLRAFHDMTADIPHIAGMTGDREITDRLVAAFSGMGLHVERHSFWALLCEPVAAQTQVVAAPDLTAPLTLPLREAIPGDPWAEDLALTIGWNAYSGSGDVTGEVVYANYGTRADFARLAALGVDCTGKIVIARYGGNYRGYKVRFAEEAGAAALIMYTDPADSGFVRGETWPRGGFNHECAIQRGSILTLGFHGDPLTPGIEATLDAPRLAIEEAGLPRIPVQPMGWVAAREILSRMDGRPRADQSWQGGLPFTYRLEGGPGLRVRVHVEQVREIRESWNVIATLPGAVEPDRWIVVGCHHDAWGHGASDPTAGLICLLESARLWSERAAAGAPPDRTIKFCAWGAEEFGIIGSTEWVEGNAEALARSAVAYVNLDMAAMGPDFGAAASPSLREVVWDAAAKVVQPNRPDLTVLEDWRLRAGLARGADPATDPMPGIGSLGGGSDHVAFLCHVGVPSIALSAGGSPGTAYHTNHDHLAWYRHTVGEDYGAAVMVTGITNHVIERLARAGDPLDPLATIDEAADRLRRALARASSIFAERGDEATMAQLDAAINQATDRAAVVRSHLRGGAVPVERAIEAERAWIDPEGLPGRPWFRNLFAATDEFSGYGAWVLPGVESALDARDAARIAQEARRVLARIHAALSAIDPGP